MKHLITIVFLILQLNVFAQSGVYEKKSDFEIAENVLIWKLTLNNDGTFIYHFYKKLNGGLPPEENFYAKGSWKAEKNLIFFYADENMDIKDTYSKKFNHSKARINSKSPRDKSDKIVETSIRFYDSDLPEIKGLELFKKNI